MKIHTWSTTDPTTPANCRAIARIWTDEWLAVLITAPDEVTARKKAHEWWHGEMVKAQKKAENAEARAARMRKPKGIVTATRAPAPEPEDDDPGPIL